MDWLIQTKKQAKKTKMYHIYLADKRSDRDTETFNCDVQNHPPSYLNKVCVEFNNKVGQSIKYFARFGQSD